MLLMIFTCFIIKMLREQSVGAFMGQFTKSENTSFFPSWLLLCELQMFVCKKALKQICKKRLVFRNNNLITRDDLQNLVVSSFM